MNRKLNGEYQGLGPEFIKGEIIMGEAVGNLPKKLQGEYAELMSFELNQCLELTKPRSREQWEKDMRDARAILCLNPENQDLLAFGKIEYFGRTTSPSQIFYEFGGWKKRKRGGPFGIQVLEGARDLAAEKFPYARLIAIVRAGNLNAQTIITENGGVKVGWINPEKKHVYDITRRQQPLEIIKMNPGGVWSVERNYQHII